MLTTRQLNIIYTVLHILNHAYNQNYSCSYELLPKPRISNELNEYTISLVHEEYLCFYHLVCHNFQMGGHELIISITILLLYCNYTILITYIYLYYNCKLFQIRWDPIILYVATLLWTSVNELIMITLLYLYYYWTSITTCNATNKLQKSSYTKTHVYSQIICNQNFASGQVTVHDYICHS